MVESRVTRAGAKYPALGIDSKWGRMRAYFAAAIRSFGCHSLYVGCNMRYMPSDMAIRELLKSRHVVVV
jgi:hypothetical protein